MIADYSDIDNEIIDAFSSMLNSEGPDFMCQLLKVFQKRIPLDIIDLKEGLQDNNLAKIKSKAHMLVGSFGIIGFTICAKQLKSLEQKITPESNSNDVKNDVYAIIDSMEHYLKKVEITLGEMSN